MKETYFKRTGYKNPSHNPAVSKLKEEIFLKKYGSKSFLGSKECLEKTKRTNLLKRGVENVGQDPSVREKTKHTCLEKYGGIGNSSTELLNKYKKSNLSKYGSENPMNCEEIKKRHMDSVFRSYGVNNPYNIPQVKENREETLRRDKEILDKKRAATSRQNRGFDNYLLDRNSLKKDWINTIGVDNPFKSEDVKKKIKKTNIDRYGVENWIQDPKNKDTAKRSLRENNYEEFLKKVSNLGLELMSPREDYINYKILSFFCKEHSLTFSQDFYQVDAIRCPACLSSHHTKWEIDLKNFLQDLGVSVLSNDRSTVLGSKGRYLEIDLLVPEKNIGIELNGIYWHTEDQREESQHLLRKTQLAECAGLRVIHFLDNEYNLKPEIVKSMIRVKLGLCRDRIYARKCEVKELSTEDYRNFLEKNHLHGYIPSSTRLGLYYKSELVFVCGFGVSRFSRNGNSSTELYRSCSKLNTNVLGGLSKLLKNFLDKKPHVREIQTFADRRFSTPHSYEKVGFKLCDTTDPNYYYTKDFVNLESRIKYQKHKLKDILPIFDPVKTEVENMRDNGFKIFKDCGNYKLKLTR